MFYSWLGGTNSFILLYLLHGLSVNISIWRGRLCRIHTWRVWVHKFVRRHCSSNKRITWELSSTRFRKTQRKLTRKKIYKSFFKWLDHIKLFEIALVLTDWDVYRNWASRHDLMLSSNTLKSPLYLRSRRYQNASIRRDRK